MYCDSLTLAAVASELRLLLGGRIQEVLAVDRWALGLEIYAAATFSEPAPVEAPSETKAAGQRHYLLISADPAEGGRIHLVSHKLRRGQENPSPLLLRLRKSVEGMRLTSVWQPPHERILHLAFSGADETLTLIVEAMGRLSNIILVEEDGTILECLRRVTSHQSRYRVVLPGHPYMPPPPQQKALASELTANRLTELLCEDQDEAILWKKLVAAVRGVSPLLAREVVFRATGDLASPSVDPRRVLACLLELQGLAQSGLWQPCLAMEEGQPVAYAPYLLTHLPQYERRASISAAMSEYYERLTGTDPYAAAKQRVSQLIESARERVTRKKQSLQRSSPADGAIADLRRKGELLFTFPHRVAPRQTRVSLGLEGEPVLSIELDGKLTAVENAQEYFRRYEKARAAAAEVPALIGEVDEELAFLEQLETDLHLALDQPGIAAVEVTLAEAGYLPKPPKSRPVPSAPLQVTSVDGFTIWVGRNSRQNEEVTFKLGSARDLWLHAEGVPGAHVIVRTEGREVPEATLRQAAELAASHSAARERGSVRVAYTLRQNVRRARSGRPGQVYLSAHKTVVVRSGS